VSPGHRKGDAAATGGTGTKSAPKTRRGEGGSLRVPASKRVRSGSRLLEHYRLLFERDLAGVYRTTLSGTILECNESFAKMLGYSSPEELLRMRASELYGLESDRKAFLKRLLAAGFMRNTGLVLRKKEHHLGEDQGHMPVAIYPRPVGAMRQEPASLEAGFHSYVPLLTELETWRPSSDW